MAEVAPHPARKTHRGHRGGQRSHPSPSKPAPPPQVAARPSAAGPQPSTSGGLPSTVAQSSGTSAQVRDAKGLALELRELLKKREPWDRDVEFQRQSVRRQYRNLVFSGGEGSSLGSDEPDGGPATTRRKVRPVDALNLLWLETSHAVIHLYRQRISAMDKALASDPGRKKRPNRRDDDGAAAPSTHTANGERGGGPKGGNGEKAVGPVARRKLVQAFRSFLANEETFWRDLVVQLIRTFSITEAQPALRALGLVGGGMDAVVDEGIERAMREGEGRRSGGGGVAMGQARMAIQREHAVALVHKALICFGDLARYRELYNESSPSTGRRQAGNANPRSKPSADLATTDRSWARASECYHQARLLLPDNGNPSNQLAVVASYAGDTVASAYHYYRAMCVRTAFVTARPNLDLMYEKALGRWKKRDGEEAKDGAGQDGEEEATAEAKEELSTRLKTDFVALHAMLFTKKRFDEVPDLNESVCADLAEAVRVRALPSELIVKMVVTAIAALWNARISRNETKAADGASGAPHAVAVEAATASHALDLFSTLMLVSIDEVSSIPTPSDPSDLGQLIPAPLRRVLPALRIVSKWTISHIEYVHRLEDRLVGLRDSSSLAVLRPSQAKFWTAYADLMNGLTGVFPMEEGAFGLDGGMWLEEDLDMLGFSPLRRSMREGGGAKHGARGAEVSASDLAQARMVDKAVHPNEEQLMRIADLGSDAKLVALSSGSPIAIMDGRLAALIDVSGTEHSQRDEELDELARRQLAHVFGRREALDDDDEAGVGAGGDVLPSDYESTEGDVVDMAMRAVVEGLVVGDEDDDGEDDVVVYQSASRGLSNQASAASFAPAQPEPTLPPPTGYGQGKTAADLLSALTGGSRTTASPPLNVGPSIWTATPAEGPPSALGGISSSATAGARHGSIGPATDMTRQRSGGGGLPNSVRDIWATPQPSPTLPTAFSSPLNPRPSGYAQPGLDAPLGRQPPHAPWQPPFGSRPASFDRPPFPPGPR